MAIMRQNLDKRLPVAQSQHNYYYDERVRETPVFKTNELVSVDRPALIMNTNSL